MSGNSAQQESPISLPKGGGALSGIGEKFSPDLFTGTGNFTVPIALPSGRSGFQPQLSLNYSSGNGNGVFGLGWSISIPGISRKTSDGVPRYNDPHPPEGEHPDVFIISGAEDLVPVDAANPQIVQYRPRTEGLFAHIERHLSPHHDFWQVKSKDGLVSMYGNHPDAVTRKPGTNQIFAWKLTETHDPFGNLIRYQYTPDSGEKDGHRWDQPLLQRIQYVDYGDPANPNFLVHVTFDYEPHERPDPFSDYRAGFEIRTTKRCRAITVTTYTTDGQQPTTREYRFSYQTDPHNGVSLLTQIDIIGHDDEGNAYDDARTRSRFPHQLPPLTFGYTAFAPEKRQFDAITGRDLPTRALNAGDMEVVDLHGSGLPDILQMNGVVRYWRNLGGGCFDLPRPMREAPPHSLADPGVQMLDADGDGRTDLLVTSGPLAGYYPLTHQAGWNQESFQRYSFAPSFSLDDPEVRLIDLDGDGRTDILRSGSRMECFFNDADPRRAWQRTHFAPRQTLDAFPNVSFSDPRVKLADVNGDGLQDILLIHDGNVEYWPNLGHGSWGARLSMQHSPRFPYGYDPQRILVGDVDGDSLADIVYVDQDCVMLWLNQSGNGWSDQPIIIHGTPPSTSPDHVRLVDLHGTGVSGVLWSTEATALNRHHLMFLDFTGGIKPYVLNEMDNHMGALTRVEYRPSTFYYLRDEQASATRWRTPLPFPVQVVARVEVIDLVSRGKLTTEYRYHHGYWDGAEREFRGFGMVEQIDTEAFEDYHGDGLHSAVDFSAVPLTQFSKPLLTKTWFHQGPVGDEYGDWEEVDYTDEYWQGDLQLLDHTERVNTFLRTRIPSSALSRRIKRDALRTLRGSILRTETYALDDESRLINGEPMHQRPYTVAEYAYDLREIAPPPANRADRQRVFFPHAVAQRTTQWERGSDPMIQFSFTDDYDEFGQPRQQTTIAMPRLESQQKHITGAVVGSFNPNETHILATHTRTDYASSSSAYIHDRVAQIKRYELAEPLPGPDTSLDADVYSALIKQRDAAREIHALFQALDAAEVRVIGHEINHYDGPDFEGLPVREVGAHGALMRQEALVFTDALLDLAYADRRPVYLDGSAALPAVAPAGFGQQSGYRLEQATSIYEAGYYVDTQRLRLSDRGMVLALQDALANETRIEYDDHDLLPVRVIDAAGLEVLAEYNYRLLQPATMIEANGSSTRVLYNPIGLPLKQYVTGIDAQGDETLGGTEDNPDIAFTYNFLNFEHHQQPIFVHASRRIHHARAAISDETIEAREYSDGFGRLIQSRAQADDMLFGSDGDEVGLSLQPDAALLDATANRVPDAVIVSGWQVFNNKGKVVESYEPFFSQGWDFQPEAEALQGVPTRRFYDPRSQVIRTLSPDGSEQRVIQGVPTFATNLRIAADDAGDLPANFEPSPWEQYTYDPNDLAAITFAPDGASLDQRAPSDHHFTPTSAVMDSMGRICCATVRGGPDPQVDWFVTRSAYDVRGNLTLITDTLGRDAFHYRYDLLNRALSVESIDAGRRTSVYDALGSLIEYRDSKGGLVCRTYDSLNRPKGMWARNDSTSDFTLREVIYYGDEGDPLIARQQNTLGRPIAHYDEAGLLELSEYDFKGNLLEKSRRTIRDDVITSGWQPDWSAPNAESALEATVYQTSSRYDALNRPVEMTFPEDVDGQRKAITPRYNRAGALEAVLLDGDVYVERIAYNAKGQRLLIAYGSGVMTRHAYDPHTFRLARLRSEGFTHPGSDALTYQPDGSVLQDFTYEYDLAGNITRIDDAAPNSGLASQDRDQLVRDFTYDALYRLISATGRACKNIGMPRTLSDEARCGFFAGGAPNPTQDNAPDLTEGYTERYTYDPAGNLLELAYTSASTQWTRRFGFGGLPHGHDAPHDNRLTSLESGGDVHRYQFDANGNLLQQNTEQHHTWDHADRMIGFRVQATPTSAPSLEARYLYSSDGMRVKKLVINQQGQISSTTYIDGLFEHHTNDGHNSDGSANDTLHVMDNQSRIAMVRVGDPLDARDASTPVQYLLGDHLATSHIVIGGTTSAASTFINREEYFPYGETSFGSFGRKRYRFSGKERDEESGLYYFGARYFAPWLARWVSSDPAGPKDGINLYVYVANNPLRYLDQIGRNKSDNPNSIIIKIPNENSANVENPDKSTIRNPGVRKQVEAANSAVNNVIDTEGVLVDTLIPERAEIRESLNSATSLIQESGLVNQDQAAAVIEDRGNALVQNAQEIQQTGEKLAGQIGVANEQLDVADNADNAAHGDRQVQQVLAGETPTPDSPAQNAIKGIRDRLKQHTSRLARDHGDKLAKVMKFAGRSGPPILGAAITLMVADEINGDVLLEAAAGEIGVGPVDLYSLGEGIGFMAHLAKDDLVSTGVAAAVPGGYAAYSTYQFIAGD